MKGDTEMDKQIVAALILNAYYSHLSYLASHGKEPIPVPEMVKEFQEAALNDVLSNWDHIQRVLTEKYPLAFGNVHKGK
jgi:hypothetical protein